MDTSNFDIVYHDAPPALDCDAGSVEEYPCGGEWLTAHYKSKDWYEMVQMADCIPCAHFE